MKKRKRKRRSRENIVDILVYLALGLDEIPCVGKMKLEVLKFFHGTGNRDTASFIRFLDKYGVAEIIGICRRKRVGSTLPISKPPIWINEKLELERVYD